MSFVSTERSRQRAQPVEMFYFRYGAGAQSYYAYTNAEQPVLAAASISGAEVVEYQKIAVERDKLESSGTLDRQTIRVRLPRDAELLEQFVSYPPATVVSLVIRQAHADEYLTLSPAVLDAPAIWAGRVVGAKFTGSSATLECEPISTSMRRLGLRRHYQHGCPLDLYGDQCLADKAAATVDVIASGVSSNTIIMPAAWFGSIATAKYLGGLAEWTTPQGNVEVRTILRIASGKDLVTSGPVAGRGLAAGTTVSVSLGCNRSQDDCLNLHKESGISPPRGNIRNYGGQDWIPTESPIGLINQYY